MFSGGIVGGVVEVNQGAVEYQVDLQLLAVRHLLKVLVPWDSRGRAQSERNCHGSECGGCGRLKIRRNASTFRPQGRHNKGRANGRCYPLTSDVEAQLGLDVALGVSDSVAALVSACGPLEDDLVLDDLDPTQVALRGHADTGPQYHGRSATWG